MRLKKNPAARSSNALPFSEWIRVVLDVEFGRTLNTAALAEQWAGSLLAYRLFRQSRPDPTETPTALATLPHIHHHFILDPFDPFPLIADSEWMRKFTEDAGADWNSIGWSAEEIQAFSRPLVGRLSETEGFEIDELSRLAEQSVPFDVHLLSPHYRLCARASLESDQPLVFPDAVGDKFNPLLQRRSGPAESVEWGGSTRHFFDTAGRYSVRWESTESARARPRDLDWTLPAWPHHRPITFWEAAAPAGERAIRPDGSLSDWERLQSERDLLAQWPGAEGAEWTPVRLKRLHLLFSAALQKILRHIGTDPMDPAALAQHRFHFSSPAAGLALAEYLRLLLDTAHFTWEEAWNQVQTTTQILLLDPPAEETPRIPIALLEALLPRHLEIIYEANRRHLDQVNSLFRGDLHQMRRLSVIEESPVKSLRLRNWCLLAAGSCEVPSCFEGDENPAWHRIAPDRIQPRPPGVHLPRALHALNPTLSALITDAIGPGWTHQPEQLSGLKAFTQDRGFQEAWKTIKAEHQAQTAALLKPFVDNPLDPTHLWEVYPADFRLNHRHLLLLLEVFDRYLKLRENLDFSPPPRVIFLPGRFNPDRADEFALVKLALHLQQLINSDPLTTDRLRLFTLLDPAPELSTALTRAAHQGDVLWAPGQESFSTAWIRCLINGAWIVSSKARHLAAWSEPATALLTFGDPALTPKNYHPRQLLARQGNLRQLLDNLNRGLLPKGSALLKPLWQNLQDQQDPHRILHDFESFSECQREADRLFTTPDQGWSSILNLIAQAGIGSLAPLSRATPVKKHH